MVKRDIYFYYITHINNLPSILAKGIMSHQEIINGNIEYTPIYDTQIISRRKNRTTDAGKSLWEYANVYFQPRNPMLFRVIAEKTASNLAIVAVDFRILNTIGAFISLGNAASYDSAIIPASDYSKHKRHIEAVISRDWWNEFDGSKREIMAELILPGQIPAEYIKAIYVADAVISEKLKNDLPSKIPIIPEPNFFFSSPLAIQLTENLGIYRGDMFFSRMHTLTISVNTVGVMGKGLASRAKYQFPDVYVQYQDMCRRKQLSMGNPKLYKREGSLDDVLADNPQTMENKNGETWFLLFATKTHWRENSDFAGIEKGMLWLKEYYKKEKIKSLALPALGCGLGNLKWEDVGPMLCKHLRGFEVPVQVYLPAEKEIKAEYLSKDYLLK